ncbi:MAG: phosphoribosylanthranilate isomerase [Bacteroidota bacterium]
MKLKVCGLKYKENIEQVAVLHPDYMGFIFYPGSKRFVGNDFVMPNISSNIKKVGVFVNATVDEIKEKVIKYKLDLVQLHGDESSQFCAQIKPIVKVMKAFGINETFDFKILESYKNSCDYFLFDTKTSEYGGSGKQFDWTILKSYNNDIPFFLSGGLDLKNINNLQLTTCNLQPFAIDVNSKFEIEPGLKDIEKLKQLKKLN